MSKAIMFLLGLAIGAGISLVGLMILANLGIDYSVPHWPR